MLITFTDEISVKPVSVYLRTNRGDILFIVLIVLHNIDDLEREVPTLLSQTARYS
jgi:hypothetical protein